MSKVVKNLIIEEYKSRFADFDDAALISIRGVTGIDTTKLRSKLRSKNIRVTVVTNNLARKAFEGSGLEALSALLEGPSALAYGGASVVEVSREVIALLKEFPKLELKGAVLDGQVFEGPEGVKRLSKFPTREEAIGQTVTLILSPARKLAGSIKGPGGRLAGVVKAVQEKLEKGETIARVG